MKKRGMALGHEVGTLQVTHPAYASTCPFRLFKGLLSSQLCGGKQQLLLSHSPCWFPSLATVTHILILTKKQEAPQMPNRSYFQL